MAGIAGIVYGFWLILPLLAFIVGGSALIVLGLAIDPPARAKAEESQ